MSQPDEDRREPGDVAALTETCRVVARLGIEWPGYSSLAFPRKAPWWKRAINRVRRILESEGE